MLSNDRGSSNKSRNQTGARKESGMCNNREKVQGQGNANMREVEQLRSQLKEERREHRRALLDIRALIDRHIAKV